MWHLSSHTRPLLLFYHFKEPLLEAQYRASSAGWHVTLLRLYCVVVALLEGQEAIGYLCNHLNDGNLLPPAFWPATAIAAGALALIILSFLWRRLTTAALCVHVCCCCILGILFAWSITSDSRLWTKHSMETELNFIPSTDKHFDTLRCFAVRHIVQRAMRDGLLNNCINWVPLALAGFNAWTTATHLVVFIAYAIAVAVTPDVELADWQLSLFYVLLCSVSLCGVSIVVERLRRMNFLTQAQLGQELQATQMADGVLNHMLKNMLADVAGNLEVFLAGEVGTGLLEDAIVCLRRGMRACKERHVYLQMVAGEYTPVLNRVNLRELGQQIASGRDVNTKLLDVVVYLDSTLLQLILENALSNASKHGAPEQPNVQLVVDCLTASTATTITPSRHCFRISVINTADPLRPPLTDEKVRSLLSGEAKLLDSAVVPTLSDGIGITHCIMAANLGGYTLSLAQAEDVVTFSITLDADVVELPQTGPDSHLAQLVAQFPNGLKFHILDDSASARRLLEFHIKRWCAPSELRCFGAVEDDVDAFLSESLASADVVILDEHLSFSEHYTGSRLCQELLRHRFTGLICIRSGDDSAQDREKYLLSGAHCCFGKDMLGAQMMQELKAAYVTHSRRRHSPLPAAVTVNSMWELDFESSETV